MVRVRIMVFNATLNNISVISWLLFYQNHTSSCQIKVFYEYDTKHQHNLRCII